MSGQPSAVIELRGVGKTYLGHRGTAVEALRDVSLSLSPGRILGLAGANGAGKTTLLEVCIGALAPTHGVVLWFGQSTLSNDAKRNIGFCPDVPAFPQRLTGREVISILAALDGVPKSLSRQRCDQLADRLGLSDALEKRVETMSRGTAVRLGLLQAIVRERDLLVCDETFAPLDPVAQLALREVLREQADRGAAILISSHQLEQLSKVADEVAIMRQGRIVRQIVTSESGAYESLERAFFGSPDS